MTTARHDAAPAQADALDFTAERDAARAVLRRDPDDLAALQRLGLALRALGALAEAAEAYGRLAALQPGQLQAAYLHDMLRGAVPGGPPAPGLLWPTPFVRIRDFLPRDERDRLFALASDPAGYDAATYFLDDAERVDRGTRSARIKAPPDDVRAWWQARLRALLPEFCARLGEPVPEGEIEAQLTAHHDGDFYAPHTDADGAEAIRGRRLSYVYYMTRRPRPFSGGDLRLYDGAPALGLYRPEAFTRIAPEDNSIVVFPSPAWHEVTPIACAGADPADGRFTLNGWVHAA